MDEANKALWGDGPWQSEPDSRAWTDPDTQLACMAIRNYGGAWCGYVAVPPSHPLYKKSYHACLLPKRRQSQYRRPKRRVRGRDKMVRRPCKTWCPHTVEHLLDAHGGITYSGQRSSDDAFWFGFDCAHYQDLIPGLEATFKALKIGNDMFSRVSTYRTLDYTVEECRRLAQQIHAYQGHAHHFYVNQRDSRD